MKIGWEARTCTSKTQEAEKSIQKGKKKEKEKAHDNFTTKVTGQIIERKTLEVPKTLG